MPDIFIEYMVKRKNTPKIILAKSGVVAATLLAAGALMMLSGLSGSLSMIATLAVFCVFYGGYHLVTSMNVEFEYSVTNGEMDIDKIMARRKRRRIATINCREADAFGKYKAEEHSGKNYETEIFACDDPDSGELWYCSLHMKDKGNTLVVFNANEKMLNAVKTFLPRPIMHEAFKMGEI